MTQTKKAKKPKQIRSAEKSKQQLLDTAKKVFARHGFRGANVRDIAKEAGVNISLISYYFGGKEGLYQACLQGFGESRLAVLDRIMVLPKNVEEFRVRMEMATEEMLTFHLAQPEMIQILLKDVHSGVEHLDKNLMKTFVDFLFHLTDFYGKCQEAGFIRREIEPLSIAALLYFAFSALIQIDFLSHEATGMSIQEPEFRKHIVHQAMMIVFDGILPREAA